MPAVTLSLVPLPVCQPAGHPRRHTAAADGPGRESQLRSTDCPGRSQQVTLIGLGGGGEVDFLVVFLPGVVTSSTWPLLSP